MKRTVGMGGNPSHRANPTHRERPRESGCVEAITQEQAAPITVDLLHDLWPKIVADVTARNARLGALVQSVWPVLVNDDWIGLWTHYEFHVAKLNEPEHYELVRDVISNLVNKHMCFDIVQRPPNRMSPQPSEQIYYQRHPLTEGEPVAIVWPRVVDSLKYMLPDRGEMLACCELSAASSDTVFLKVAGENLYKRILDTPDWQEIFGGLCLIWLGRIMRVEFELCQDLATMPYAEYLKTDHWQKTAKAAKERAGHKCQVCNKYGQLHTHHRTYERRGAELPDDLIVLCAGCHKLFHDHGKLAK